MRNRAKSEARSQKLEVRMADSNSGRGTARAKSEARSRKLEVRMAGRMEERRGDA